MLVTQWVNRMVLSAILLFGVGLSSSSAQTTDTDQKISLYQRQAKVRPYDSAMYHRLGDAYIQKARESGDMSYFDRAEKALRKALEIAPKNSGASLRLAYVFYSRHQFEEAANQALKALELDPADSHLHGILGDAFLETGKYEKAEEAYHKMVALQVDLYSYGRLAGLKSFRGDGKGAIEDLKRAIAAGKANGSPRESIAWTEWQLGSDYFLLGDLESAQAQYLEALETYPNYYRALAGLAQVRGAQNRHAEAIDLYKKALGVIPMPEYAAALGDLYVRIGRFDEAKKQYQLVEYIGYLNTFNKVLYNRELAYFYADHDMKLKQALELAEKELEVRRDIYAYDVLAWAFYKNGKPQAALIAMKEALKLGTKDAKLFFHAGMIYQRLGEIEKAKEFLARALATNPHFHILHADVARRTLDEIERQADALANNQGNAE